MVIMSFWEGKKSACCTSFYLHCTCVTCDGEAFTFNLTRRTNFKPQKALLMPEEDTMIFFCVAAALILLLEIRIPPPP